MKLKSNVILLIFVAIACASGWANQAFTVNCSLGGQKVTTQGVPSTTKVNASYPGCQVTVFTHGVVSPLPSIFDDNGNAMANPFTTSSTTGQGLFAAPNGRYDVTLSGGGMPTPVTITDVFLNDASTAPTMSFCSVAYSATPVFNASSCNIFQMTLSGNVTSSTYTSAASGQQAIFILCQDSTGGRTFSWPSTMTDQPPINQTANQCTNVYFVADSTPLFHAIGVAGDGSHIVATTINNGTGSVSIPSSGSASIVAGSNGVVPSSCAASNYVKQINSSGVITCGAPVTANTGTSHQFFSSNTAAGVFTGSQPTLSDVAAGTASSGTYDFSGVTLFKGRVAAGLTTAANGAFGFDSTNNNWHFWNGADNLMGLWSATPTTGNCVKSTVSANKVSITDNGGPCAATIASASHQFLTSYTSTTGAFTQAQPAFTDISGTIAAAAPGASQLPNPTSTTLGGVESIAAVSKKFLTSISTSGVPAAAQPAPSDLSGEVDGQCIIGAAGAWTAGACSGSAQMQLIGVANSTSVTANAVSTAVQTLQSACTTTPCYGAGVLNTLNKTIDFDFSGTLNGAINSTETVAYLIGLTTTPTNTVISFVTGGTGAVEYFHIKGFCKTTTTGAAGQMFCSISSMVSNELGVTLSAESNAFFAGLDLTSTISPTMGVSFTTASATNSVSGLFAITHQEN